MVTDVPVVPGCPGEVALALEGGAVGPATPSQLGPVQPSSPATILLAEDDSAVRGLLARVLRKAGFEVIDAIDGMDALEKWRQHAGAVDLVVTDVVMPRMAGPELIRRLRLECPSVRVLYVSGFTFGAALTDRAEFMAKPLHPTELVARVRTLLGQVQA